MLAEAESAQQLSDLFYSCAPHDYFDWRFGLLALAGDQTKDLEGLFREGISFGGFEISKREGAGDGGADPDQAELDEEARRRYSFAVAEATALLHHISETLLRLYFAHCELPVAPWLEIARERIHSRFKERVRARFVDSEADEAGYRSIAQVFWATVDHTKLSPPIEESEFRAGIENIDKWLRFFARNFLDDAHLYNALKHGLAVNAGDSALKIGDGEIFKADGPSLLYLGVKEEKDRRVWALTTRWIDLAHTMGACYIGIKLIETLWSVSRFRYTGKTDGQIGVYTGPPYEETQKAWTAKSATGAGVVIASMSMNLRYYAEPDDPEDNGA